MNTEEFARLEGRFDVDPQIQHHFSSGVYAKQMLIPKGFTANQHKHKYSHLSILASGRALIKTDEYNTEVVAPCCLDIAAEKYHQIVALEDCVWFCIHATEETDPQKVDEITISRS
jgi:hypothetical protein